MADPKELRRLAHAIALLRRWNALAGGAWIAERHTSTRLELEKETAEFLEGAGYVG